ncbi:nucleotide-diphospho-sugar transferase [Filobasidium floriforme]|uniref:nucleotide-diphospho-sugar transferase n=1 Tax=Filobasidium floriforme TaxID=5210 RepID=UPI001E8CE89A|nr:nucleotide-diphospho-sugar transferase [Filobasidium floriforme]KAH8080127.1 nucleotide-diphospho-sugar transferase [Filobasidium floriforme]
MLDDTPATTPNTTRSRSPTATTVKACWTTLITKPQYLQGLVVLQSCLQAVQSRYPLVVMVTPTLDKQSREVIAGRGMEMVEVESLRPVDEGANGGGGVFERFGDTWTKLRAFELVQWERVVLLDCDMVVLQNMDELMTLPLPSTEWIAAAHACTCNPRKIPTYPEDWVPENCAYTPLTHPTALSSPTPAANISPLLPTPSGTLPSRGHALLNSGLVILHPSHLTCRTIENYIQSDPEVPSFKFPDQDALAVLFQGKWKSLGWCYNALKTLRKVHPGVWRDDEIRCLHYILDKPWEHLRSDPSADATGTHEWWWEKYEDVLAEMKRVEGSGWEVVDRWVKR